VSWIWYSTKSSIRAEPFGGWRVRMKLNPLGISVTDVLAAYAFLEKYFSFRGIGKATDKMAHLQDDGG
jgi:hypothetical protein